jgi:carbon-monoxide dehydrogenase large subunit
MTGASRGRREDLRFVTGQGRYTADWTLPDVLHASFRRSDLAHARIRSVDTRAAAGMPGVVAVFSAADFEEDAFGNASIPVPLIGRDGQSMIVPPRPVLARERVRFVGEEIALIVAETHAEALDAAERIDVDYEPLPAVVGVSRAIAEGAPQLHDEVPGNRCFDFEYGDPAGAGRAMGEAVHRVRAVVDSPRVSAAPMEPRSVLAWYDTARDTYEIRCSNQGSDAMVGLLAELLKVDRSRIRMHVVDVGGGFGPRNAPYPEYVALLEAARRIGRPIRWTSTRSEDFLCDSHGRGVRLEGELGLDAEGRFIALRTDWLCDQGAYLTSAGPVTNVVNGRNIATGGYAIPAFHGRHRLMLTNANPHNAYRGAGRPEANLIIERLVDKAARQLGIDPLRLRQLNALGPERFPYRTPTGSTFDSGDYPRLLEIAARESDWLGFPARRAEALARGRWRGIGCALFVEPSGGGFLPQDEVALRFDAKGRVRAYVATTSNGQGHETVFPELIAARLGIDSSRITLHASDPYGPEVRGNGSIGSRSIMAQGSALGAAADEAARKGLEIAAHLLEVARDDLVFGEGAYRVRGTDRVIGLIDVIQQAAPRDSSSHPMDTDWVQRSPQAFTSGVHVAELEIDPETGETKLVSYLAVDDLGRVIDEIFAEAQIVGGIAQAAGQVFGETCLYDLETGQLLTASFQDYVMPRADWLPHIRVLSSPTLSPSNSLGAKGAGEAGTTGGVVALMNAVCDAMSRCGIEDFDMPATAHRIWTAIHAAKKASRAEVCR